ncbi:hypothetical protein CSKR_114189 [Clonorchis sinensis]|uniref:Uncharacterized protein n=1 Tax=Clonorchis sinensis TaxID=79923 RepID=A0A419PN64_CLOSI|nr:hypothetical protein CSKR_114189 [Clonorchis sinensis]
MQRGPQPKHLAQKPNCKAAVSGGNCKYITVFSEHVATHVPTRHLEEQGTVFIRPLTIDQPGMRGSASVAGHPQYGSICANRHTTASTFPNYAWKTTPITTDRSLACVAPATTILAQNPVHDRPIANSLVPFDSSHSSERSVVKDPKLPQTQIPTDTEQHNSQCGLRVP